MSHGGNQTQRVDIIDSFDPRIEGRAAQKGTFFRYIPVIGNAVLLVKQDDGFSTDWVDVASGAAQPVTPVSAASVANVTIATAPATIDGIAYTTVLLKDQTLPAQNGVYDFHGAGQPLTRNSSWDEAAEFSVGRQVFVVGGTTQANTLWINQLAVVTLGTDPIEFVEISSASFMLTNFSNSVAASKNLDLGTHKLVNVLDPTLAQDAATKNYVDTHSDATKMNTNFSNAVPSTVAIDLNSHLIHNVLDPVAQQDAATKNYVDFPAFRIITGTDTLVTGVDRKAICNAGAGAFVLNLPPNQNGLTFIIGQAATNVGVFTITPNGGDTLDANIQAIFNSNQPVEITCQAGVWYAI